MAFFDSYDESAKGIVMTTYDLATKQHHNPVDIPHLFFVLMNQSNHEIADLLKEGGASMDMVKTLTKQSLAGLLSVDAQFSISKELNDIFVEANTIAKNMHDTETSPYHIFLAFLKSKSQITEQLHKQGISYEKMEALIKAMPKSRLHTEQDITPEQVSSGAESLSKFSEDLTQLARDGKLKQVIGRDKELEQMVEVLCRKEKNNIIILGESGVGKTALAEFLAQKIVSDEVPAYLQGKQILRINLGSLLAGTKFRGEFEDKINHLIKTVKESQGKIILFIDEFHNVAGAGKSEGSMDLSEMLKPELSSGNIQIIGATTTAEFRKNVEKDTGLTRRFETLTLQEPTIQDTLTILRGIEQSFESYHGVTILDSALIAAAELSDKYIKDRKLPDKAISLVDQAATKVKISITSFPSILTDLKEQTSKLNREKHSLLEEIEKLGDEKNIQQQKTRLSVVDTELKALETSYAQKKTAWETMKTLFGETIILNKQINELQQQSKTHESASELDKVSEIQYGKIPELQKTVTANKERLTQLQKESGIIFKDTVEREDIAKVVSAKTGIPLTQMAAEESEKLAHLEEYLATKVIGQSEAISAISNAIRRARIGLKDPKKPIGSFIFLGPTGVGKTELAKALAEFLFFDKKAMVRLNMSEYQSESSPSKLIGSDPGLVGYEEGGQLTEAIKRKPYSVILLDEVEKAHPKVFDLFLQVLDDGMLNDSFGNTIDFKNTIILMTSNIGSAEIMEKLQGNRVEIGDLYNTEVTKQEEPAQDEDKEVPHKRNRRPKKKKTAQPIENKQGENNLNEELKEELKPIMMDFFRPEFLNRMDDTIIFNPISPDMFKQILEIKIKQQAELISSTNKISLEISDAAKNYLAKKGRDPANGARPIDRALQSYLINPLVKEIIGGKFQAWDVVKADFDGNKLTFSK